MLHNTLVNRVKAQLIDLETNYLTTLSALFSKPRKRDRCADRINIINSVPE